MKIVVATDGSPSAQHALLVALDIASRLREPSEIHAVAVVDYVTAPMGLGKAPPTAPDLLAGEAEAVLALGEEIAAEQGAEIRPHLLRGHVATTILTFAREIRADLIVVGTHGRKGVIHSMLGSTCDHVVRNSPIPVLTVQTAA